MTQESKEEEVVGDDVSVTASRRSALGEFGVFAGRWFRGPQKVGSVMPSWPALSRAMASHADPDSQGYIVELGGGTGVITRALLDAGVAPERLIIIERDEGFHRLLEKQFPDICIVQTDAMHMKDELMRRTGGRIEGFISSLPLRAFPKEARNRVLEQAFGAMNGRGYFIQFTYWLKSPASQDILSDLGLDASATDHVWLNVPPATVWKYEQRG